MGIMAFRALALLDRPMRALFEKRLPVMTHHAQVQCWHGQEFALCRLVRRMTHRAHAAGNRLMNGRAIELFLFMTVVTKVRHSRHQQFGVRRDVWIVASGTHTPDNRHMYELLRGKGGLVMTHETQIGASRCQAAFLTAKVMRDIRCVNTCMANSTSHAHSRMYIIALRFLWMAHGAVRSFG